MGRNEYSSSNVEENNNATCRPPRPSPSFRNQKNNPSSSYVDLHGSAQTSTDSARRLYEGEAFQNAQIASSPPSSLKTYHHKKRTDCERGNGVVEADQQPGITDVSQYLSLREISDLKRISLCYNIWVIALHCLLSHKLETI